MQETVYKGVTQSTANIQMIGNVYGLASNPSIGIDEIRFSIGLAPGTPAIDLTKMYIVFVTQSTSPQILNQGAIASTSVFTTKLNGVNTVNSMNTNNQVEIAFKIAPVKGNTKMVIGLHPSVGEALLFTKYAPAAIAATNVLPSKTLETPTPTMAVTTVPATPTPKTTSGSSMPGPTQTLPEMWNLDVQVQSNGFASDPQIITTVRGGKGINFIQQVDVKVTRSDGIVETGIIPKPLKVGDSVSLASTTAHGYVDRAEVWATDPQGAKVKIFDDYVPFRTYN